MKAGKKPLQGEVCLFVTKSLPKILVDLSNKVASIS